MVTDATATLEERVRSYLAANCAQCHRPGGVRANFDARYETPLQLQGIINGAVNNPLDIPDAAVVSPGAIFNSILYLRLNSLNGEIKMPPLARNTIDAAAVTTLADWIQTLPPAANALGLRGEYFDQMNLTGSNLVRIDKAINFDWGAGSPDPAIGVDAFSVRWTGEIEPRFSELYTFYTASDDGVRLWVNNQLLIDHWTDHAMAEDHGSIALVAGQKYPVRLEYFENGGQAGVRLEWSSPSQYRELIPPSQLSPPTEDSFAFPPVSLQVEHLRNGQIRLRITAKTLAQYRVEASTNFIDWSPIMPFVATNGLFFVTDLEATNFSRRFYRVIGAPRESTQIHQ
jgi:mono/diheme cytochrome c family protein